MGEYGDLDLADELMALRTENEKLRELLIEARDWIDKGESGWTAFAAKIDVATKDV